MKKYGMGVDDVQVPMPPGPRPVMEMDPINIYGRVDASGPDQVDVPGAGGQPPLAVPDGYPVGPAEGEGMDPSELAHFKRAPLASNAPPIVQAPADAGADKEMSAAKEADRRNNLINDIERTTKGFTSQLLAQPMAEMITKPTDEAGALKSDREKLREYLLRKQGLDTKALFVPQLHQPKMSAPPIVKLPGELDDELKRAQIDSLKARTGKALAPKAGNGASGPTLNKSGTELRKEFNQLPQVKAYTDVDASFQKVQAAAKDPTAAGDLSLIYGFMKMVDPGSSVKEGEFASAQNAGGVDDKLRALYNNLKQGQRLTPEQRSDFVARAQQMYAAHVQQLNDAGTRYGDIAKRAGVDPEDVIVHPRKLEGADVGTNAHPQDSEAVKWAKANPDDPRSAAILKANGVQP